MRCIYCFGLLLLVGCTPYKRIHYNATLADTHNDILTACFEHNYSFDQNLQGKTHSDLQRFEKGGVDVQVFSVWCDGTMPQPFAYANKQIDTLYSTINRNTNSTTLVSNSTELGQALQQKKLAALIGVEGGHMIENNLDNLTALYNRGVRYLTLTWNNSTSWASSAADETAPSGSPGGGVTRAQSSPADGAAQKKDSLQSGAGAVVASPPQAEGREGAVSWMGLSTFGKQVVQKMNALGMLVDVSHVGEKTFWDVIATTTKPVIASHSSVYTLCPVFRNLKDDQIKAIGKNGGVVFINFYSGFIDSSFNRKAQNFDAAHRQELDSLLKLRSEPYFAQEYLSKKYAAEVQSLRPPLSMLIDHIDYVAKLVGVEGVGIGSDFDGVSSLPQQINSVLDYPLISKALLQRGYSKTDVQKILGGNFIRVLQAAER